VKKLFKDHLEMFSSLKTAPRKELIGGTLLIITLFAFTFISIAIFG